MNDELIERVAEALWQAEGLRAMGRKRSVPWAEWDETDREKWRGLARAAQAAMADHFAEAGKVIADRLVVSRDESYYYMWGVRSAGEQCYHVTTREEAERLANTLATCGTWQARALAAKNEVRWCRPRLRREIYRQQLDSRLPLPPAPESDEPAMVASEE